MRRRKKKLQRGASAEKRDHISQNRRICTLFISSGHRAVPATSDAESMNEQEVVGIVEVE